MSLRGICSGGSGVTQCPTQIKLHNSRLWKGDLCQRIARDVVSTTDGRVDATVDRAAWLRTLAVLQGMAKVLFHSDGNGVDNQALNHNRLSMVLTSSSAWLVAAMLVATQSNSVF